MPAYDTSFSPPAPVADVTVVHPITGVSSGVLGGKLDSGADVTVIPERLMVLLGLTPKGRIWTRGYDGTYSRRPLYYVRLMVEGFDLLAVRCIAADRTDVLLGRNVLNRFIITLDGKNLTFELKDP
ncbi:MAG: retroviral-like aspartic protease family protein [Candidatus Tectomicrobia bacterium]|nr:retroviral-like aspartic protease family protein [Candidatus Tectomicrobia bacterium]